jgi:Transposase DDE domain group 1
MTATCFADPAFKMAVGRLPETGVDLCSQATMTRLENLPGPVALKRMMAAPVELFCDSFDAVPRRILLDIDHTKDRAYGGQAARPLDLYVPRRRLPSGLRRRRRWRDRLHRLRHRVLATDHRRRKSRWKSDAAGQVGDIASVRCSPHADPQSRAPDTRHHDVASDRGGERAAAMYTLIATAKLNGSTRRLGSPACSAASPTTRPPAPTNSCRGIGKSPQIKPMPPNPLY